jgi:hypothetical protein
MRTSWSDNVSASSPSSSRHRATEIGSGSCSARSGTSIALPFERESRRFVLNGWRARARRCVGRRADVRVSADAGLRPASSRRSSAPSGDDREWFDRLLRSVRPGQRNAAGERIPFAALDPEDDARREVTRLAVHVACRPTVFGRRATDCDVVRIALGAVPCGRRPDARSVGRCGERRECRAALT